MVVRTTGCVEVSASGSPLKTNCCASKRENVLVGMQDYNIYTLLAYIEIFINKIRGQTKLAELEEALRGVKQSLSCVLIEGVHPL